MKKIIFLDVDGTLVDYENNIPNSAIKAIQKAREKGHRIYLCTGRSKAEVYQEIWDIGLDGMIGGNGSYIEDKGNVVLHQMITKEQCRRIVDWLHKRKLEFFLESNSGLYASENFEEKGEAAISQYAKKKGKENVTVRSMFPNMIFGEDLYRDDLNKVSFILSSFDDFLEAKKTFLDLQVGTWGGKGQEALFGDFGVKDITKAYAVDTLLRYLKADLKDTIAFGDAKVDISMLEYCAYGVAMGNGAEEIKAIADYVTDDIEKDGLSKAFDYLGLTTD